jgi:hypothetical protein
MKSCPTCHRTYADDTFTFCLDDGALLSTSYDPHATLRIPDTRPTAPARTEILPNAPTPDTPRPAPLSDALQASATLVYGSQAGQNRLAKEHSRKRWFIVGGVVVLVAIGLVIALGYVVWQAKDKRVSEPSENSSAVPTNRSVVSNTNGDTSEAKIPDDSLKWFDGVWEGTGYQTNPKSNWSIKLTAQNDTYVIEYPSLSCRGEWALIKKESGKARFKETITRGLGRCENNGTVLIERIDDAQVSFKYSSPNTKAVTSTATLRKRAESTEPR